MNVSNPQLVWQLAFEGAWPTAVAFLGSGRRLAAANQLGQVFVWDLPETPPALPAEPPPGLVERRAPDHPPFRALVGHTNGVTALVAAADGRRLVSASVDHTLRVWDTDAPATGTAEFVLDGESRKVVVQRTGDQSVLSAPGVPVETLAASHTLEGHDDWVLTLSASRDGRRLVSGDAAARVIVWDLVEPRELARWSGYPWNWIVAAALSPDGETALVSEFRYKRDDFDLPAPAVRLLAATGEEKLDLLKTQFPDYDPQATSYGAAQVWGGFTGQGLIAADFSPDGALVALGQGGEIETGKVHLVDTSTGTLVRDVAAHQYGVTAVHFSADGQFVLSTGRDTALRITRVDDGTEAAVLGEPRGGQFKDWFTALAVSPDERWIAAADLAGLVHVWRLDE
jgi:WD40 repeat protein